MGGTASVPMLSLHAGLTHYLTEIRKFPMLRPDQEVAYAVRWREHGDREAAYHLVTSHLRLVAKIAMRYRGYGLPVADIISEGNVGLMQAVKRFEPERGFRLATYAIWRHYAECGRGPMATKKKVKRARKRPVGDRIQFLTTMSGEVIMAVKEAGLKDGKNDWEIMEEAAKEWLARRKKSKRKT